MTKSGWRPEVLLANPTLPDSEGLATLRALQDAAAGTPIMVTTGAVTEGVRRQLDALVGVAAGDRIGNALAARSGFPITAAPNQCSPIGSRRSPRSTG